jgi:hypothetical protein
VKRSFSIITLLSMASSAWGGPGTSPDKSCYDLFHPTPRELMRSMSTDRPDVTESPYTVDAGHAQLEMSLIDYTLASGDETFVFAPFNLKLGLTNSIDLQFVFDPYIVADADDPSGGGDTTNSGAGDMQLRLKVNLWGNDEGGEAMALMPFIQFPTASDRLGGDRLEGGLIIPFAIDLPHDWSLGLMAEFDAVHDQDDDDYDLEFVHSVTVGHDIAGSLAGFGELVGAAATDSNSPYRAQIGAGLTYALTDDVQMDGGVYFGLTDESDDLNLFMGVSMRF